MLLVVSSLHLHQNLPKLFIFILYHSFYKKIRQFIAPLIEVGDFLPIRLKILGIMITISIISYILSKIYIIFELPKTKELKYFSSKLIISLANEIRSIELLICFAIISIIFSFMVI